MLKRYFVVQCIANLLLFLERNPTYCTFISSTEEARMLAIIENYMETYSPLEVQTRESKTTSWQSMKPFAQLLQSHNKTIFQFGELMLF
jgi:hypothetical protein